MELSYKQLLPKISTFIFDVDGVLTNGMLTIMPSGELVRHMNVKDGYAMKIALNKGFRVCIISGGTNQAVKSRLAALGIEDIYLGAHDKIQQYNEIVGKYNLSTENVLYMGDDIPDLPVMQKVGLASCPNDAVPEIQNASKYISNLKGGEGCVRDVIEQVLKVQGKWNDYFDAEA
ncbi:KdsC family phosphatase [Polaribacter dokdonensis]|uniref:3-deoxy-D-manno-octulosonate 8-phosphate phosphatase (KDO 8-P phosphatase) n=1 Tax=Polaribacter dokdonensis DSW-5 TaxID=1300348 RepID=A0A0N0UNU4_9FLAO|nr:HAD-IIIA family hydrolase [Polaribacter dokdonensis]KOY52560.1 Haloacid dehalogenase-like hydrolase [Polaribacter dokdonensis DSW-5]SEE47963.1 3-deoxy-D-manno-octulosonate 8-phosphate phosphatase (KDO 8-P phosphatase) [Polaribacter dokdonensis DSW-5]